jgi:diguanylate cyclase (GGDEF)-like protein
MSTERQRFVRLLLDEYIALYTAKDVRLLDRFSENFSGLVESSERPVASREWTEALQQQFLSAPAQVHIQVNDFFAQELADDVLLASALLHLSMAESAMHHPPAVARLVLVFRLEQGDWKIVHSSSSVPFVPAPPPEALPSQRQTQRILELQDLLEERSQALTQAQAQLQLIATTDVLTGIANGRKFDQALAQAWTHAQRTHAPLSLIMLDMDAFKHFNDHYGHLAGGKCLQALALTLTQTGGRNQGDLVARFGGEKFVLLLPASDAKAAMDVARQVQHAVQALALPHEGTPLGIVTLSIGVATMAPQRDQTSEELVRRADRAMHRAKQAGRNRIEVAAD